MTAALALAALLCGASPAAGPPRATAEDRRVLEEILARPEYRRAEADPAALRRALLSLWGRVLELLGTAEAERYARTGRVIFLAAAAGAAALGVAAVRRRRRRAGGAGAGVGTRAGEPPEPPDASGARAEAALRAGEAREVVRQAFLLVLGALERAGRVPRGRALTNGEIARRVDGEGPAGNSPALTPSPRPSPPADAGGEGGVVRDRDPRSPVRPERSEAASAAERSRRAAIPPLTPLAALFDRAVYGEQPVSLPEAEAALRASRAIAAALEGT